MTLQRTLTTWPWSYSLSPSSITWHRRGRLGCPHVWCVSRVKWFVAPVQSRKWGKRHECARPGREAPFPLMRAGGQTRRLHFLCFLSFVNAPRTSPTPPLSSRTAPGCGRCCCCACPGVYKQKGERETKRVASLVSPSLAAAHSSCPTTLHSNAAASHPPRSSPCVWAVPRASPSAAAASAGARRLRSGGQVELRSRITHPMLPDAWPPPWQFATTQVAGQDHSIHGPASHPSIHRDTRTLAQIGLSRREHHHAASSAARRHVTGGTGGGGNEEGRGCVRAWAC